MNRLQERLCWALAGVVLGIGVVSFLSVGLPLVLLVVILLIHPLRKKIMPLDTAVPWILMAAMGLSAAAFLMVTYLISDHSTDYFPSSYWFGLLSYAVIGLAGLVGGVITMARREQR